MSLLHSDTLIVEQPWTAGSLLLRPSYRAEVYDGRDFLLASVREGDGPGLQRPLRYTGLSGLTTFDLVVTAPTGQPLLGVHKDFGRRPHLHVTVPGGRAVGSIKWLRRTEHALLDTSGRQLCLLGDVAHLKIGDITKRNGKRVRRDVIQIRPGTAEPLRSLAIAGGVAFDVLRGKGTSHTSGDISWPVG